MVFTALYRAVRRTARIFLAFVVLESILNNTKSTCSFVSFANWAFTTFTDFPPCSPGLSLLKKSSHPRSIPIFPLLCHHVDDPISGFHTQSAVLSDLPLPDMKRGRKSLLKSLYVFFVYVSPKSGTAVTFFGDTLSLILVTPVTFFGGGCPPNE